ncbi:hypothetical protein [Nocardia sp. NBC_01377]|uniref:hypothetical protein n=1 Tax=Nocardia sp. NBC_01377 TaxID=2903595 RepID=UPI0038679862
MPALRLAVMLPPSADVDRTAQLARTYEEAGVDVIAVPEAYGVDAISWLGSANRSRSWTRRCANGFRSTWRRSGPPTPS